MWIIYALLSSLIWGANYLFYEKILHRVSVSTLLMVDFAVGALFFLGMSLVSGNFAKDFAVIQSSRSVQLLILATVVTTILADFFIAFSIQSKNATLATLIEISYPLFVIILGWLLYKQNTLSLSVIVGSLLIFAGIGVIYFFNK